MDAKKAVTIAQAIIDTNIYLTLGTTDGTTSWVAPLFYCADNKNQLYVISQPSSRHIRDIASNRHISFAIFDSHAEEGKGNGIQATGIMKECKGTQIANALRFYHTNFIPCTKDSFTKGPYRLYKITPKKIYILDPDAPTDKRIQV